jgi:hypothetical protein
MKIRNNALSKGKLNVSSKTIKKNQLMRRIMNPVRMCRRNKIPLLSRLSIMIQSTFSRSSLRLRRKIQNLSNLIRSLKGAITVMKKTRRNKPPLREPRKSSKVLIISRELPCRPNKLPLMNGQEISMAVLHQSK